MAPMAMAPGAMGFHDSSCAEYLLSAANLTKGAQTVLALWLIVLALVLFAVIGGVAIAKFLFFVLIAAAILALIGLFTRTA
jgi:hypothetical protein